MIRTYSDLILIPEFEKRIEYLQVLSKPAEQTFGPLRDVNQRFYQSREWKNVRGFVIARDFGWDLGIPGEEIFGRVLVHHMNPLNPKDIYHNTVFAVDPEFLITVSNPTHLRLHFGGDPIGKNPIIRTPGDTKLW